MFGESVSLDGDTALVGAPEDDDLGEESGSAYVFVRDPETGYWTEQDKLTAHDGAPNDIFADSVALDGDTALVGALFDDDNGINTGSAYVFIRDPETGKWTEQDKLVPINWDGGQWFGYSVDLEGDIALVGARFGNASEGGCESYVGNAYLFSRDAEGNWTEQVKLIPSECEGHDFFGTSVALDGERALVGAPRNIYHPGIGSAYLFEIAEIPDTDRDGFDDSEDNCPEVPNPDQLDLDDDGIGDACDSDRDGDYIENDLDNCPEIANTDQANYDGDAQGDVCDTDDDNDGVLDSDDPFPMSNTDLTVIIGGCDSGVTNLVIDGASFSDLIGQCAATASNHGRFVSCVTHLATDWLQGGRITGKELAMLVNAANGVTCLP